jgi:hypothetical protein
MYDIGFPNWPDLIIALLAILAFNFLAGIAVIYFMNKTAAKKRRKSHEVRDIQEAGASRLPGQEDKSLLFKNRSKKPPPVIEADGSREPRG